MKFQFLKDEELFHDLEKVNDKARIALLTMGDALMSDEYSFYGKYHKNIHAQLKKEGRIEASSSDARELDNILNRKRIIVDDALFDVAERAADEFADKEKLVAFPPSRVTHRVYRDKNDTVVHDYNLNYFDEQAKRFGFMSGPGRVGSFMGRVSNEERIITGKDESFIPAVVFLLGFTAFLLLCIGGYLPYVPDFLTDLMNAEWGFFARLPVVIILAIGCCCLLALDSEEIGGLVGFMANGLFRMILAIGSVLSGLKIIMESGYPLEIIYFLPYIAYFVLLTLSFMLQALFSLPKRLKKKKQAKEEMLEEIERNIEHMHRYIRLHVLWWENLNGKKALPKGISNLQKSFDHTLELYKKYH